MPLHRYGLLLAGATLVVVLAGAGFFTRGYWLGWLTPGQAGSEEETHMAAAGEPRLLKLSKPARDNLKLTAQPVRPRTYPRTIQVPGMVVDRPGQSDRGVTAPAVGIITKVHAFPGDTVKAGDRLFTLRLISEYLQNTQTELFKASRDAQLVHEQKDRLKGLVGTAIPEARLIELDNQLRRLNALVQAYRQDLLTRGLSPAHLDSVAAGKFVAEIEVVAPAPLADIGELVSVKSLPPPAALAGLDFEVQELKAELGQQVQAGQTLCLLANHRALYIEGRGFKREAAGLEQAAQQGWPVRVEFSEDDDRTWPALEQTFQVRHLANSIDPASRTFAFYLPLQNQSRAYEKDGQAFLVWRFRPGQRVRLHVPVEQLGKDEEKVIVLPAAAVVREGPEAYVFRQNGDLFERLPVRVVYEDRLNVVLANDGSIKPGFDYIAQGSAASLNRVLKAQNSSGGLPPGAHFHADGSLHVPGK